jgi:ribosomal protein S18 acetylase RimI-like enzyme
MNLVRVSPKSSEAALAIVQDACERLSTLGVRQWPLIFPRDYFDACVARDEVYGLAVGDDLAAVFRITWQDVDIWGPDDGAAGYIHTLSVHRRYSHQGIGRLAIRLAQDEIRTACRPHVRLDCVAHNPFLSSYYETLGFRFIREQQVRDLKLKLYEKEA